MAASVGSVRAGLDGVCPIWNVIVIFVGCGECLRGLLEGLVSKQLSTPLLYGSECRQRAGRVGWGLSDLERNCHLRWVWRVLARPPGGPGKQAALYAVVVWQRVLAACGKG